MRFAEFYAGTTGPHLSFEIFPPKTDAAMASLRRVLPELIDLRPSYMTVTYGALGSTRERTLEIAALLKREHGMETACHLTCVGSSRADLDRLLDDIQQAGIENIVALRGDPPNGETVFVPPPDGYRHASELVAHIRRRHGDASFGLAVAGYPEKHVESRDRASDLKHLLNKVNAGADLVITQLFYDNADFFAFVEAARTLGVRKPIVPGLLPVLSARQVRRITSLCGAKIPPLLQAELEASGGDDGRAEEVGIRQCVAQATELLRRGVPGIHFYVLNKSSHMRRIVAQLRPVLAEARRT